MRGATVVHLHKEAAPAAGHPTHSVGQRRELCGKPGQSNRMQVRGEHRGGDKLVPPPHPPSTFHQRATGNSGTTTTTSPPHKPEDDTPLPRFATSGARRGGGPMIRTEQSLSPHTRPDNNGAACPSAGGVRARTHRPATAAKAPPQTPARSHKPPAPLPTGPGPPAQAPSTPNCLPQPAARLPAPAPPAPTLPPHAGVRAPGRG
jgi:hypothetical protein